MLVELLRLVLVVALLLVLPGLLLVNAVFPPQRRRMGWLERGYLSVAGGVVLLILVGVTLGFLPHGSRGWFQTAATGTPNVELAMLALSVVLFYVGLARGSYPRIAARFPKLLHPEGKKQAPQS